MSKQKRLGLGTPRCCGIQHLNYAVNRDRLEIFISSFCLTELSLFLFITNKCLSYLGRRIRHLPKGSKTV
jgi:hypothetical protein